MKLQPTGDWRGCITWMQGENGSHGGIRTHTVLVLSEATPTKLVYVAMKLITILVSESSGRFCGAAP